MSTQHLVFLDASTLDRGDLNLSILERFGRLTLYPTTAPEEVAARIADAQIVLTNKVPITGDLMKQAPGLRFIAVCATGTNDIDLTCARERGIRVSNAAGYGTSSVAQHVFAFMLNWATQMHLWTRESAQWSESTIFTRLDYPVIELEGRTLGLIGTGRIGSRVGKLAEAFGMKVVAWDRYGAASETGWPRFELKHLLGMSDFVSLHCPLTPETRSFMNRERLGWMRPGSFLINTGRGALVDEAALVEALQLGKIGGAGLDVLSTEPPPADNPLLHLNLPNLLITPHSAWTAREARMRLLDEVVANIEAFLKGSERNRVA